MTAVVPESTWTPSRPDCPFPERWSAVDAYATEIEVTELVAAFVRALQPDFCVETGSWVGTTARAIGQALIHNGHGDLVSLEIDPVKARIATRLCEDLPVTIVEESSMTYRPDRPIDFAWFDCDAHRRQDAFRNLLPWMHARTVVGFHDTGPQHPVRGLLEPLERDGLLVGALYLPTPRGVCFARVGV